MERQTWNDKHGKAIPKLTELEEYYNKFNEEKRLDSRHGQVEFITSMQYIHAMLREIEKKKPRAAIRILDVGAGTGRYCIPLSEEGYQVTAIEPVRHNLGRLMAKKSKVEAYQGNACRLKRFSEDTFDLTLLFGPLYHLHDYEDKKKALLEAKRVTTPDGILMVAYIMNEFSVITYAFKEKTSRGRSRKECWIIPTIPRRNPIPCTAWFA